MQGRNGGTWVDRCSISMHVVLESHKNGYQLTMENRAKLKESILKTLIRLFGPGSGSSSPLSCSNSDPLSSHGQHLGQEPCRLSLLTATEVTNYNRLFKTSVRVFGDQGSHFQATRMMTSSLPASDYTTTRGCTRIHYTFTQIARHMYMKGLSIGTSNQYALNST